jgi:hypothetical protein
MLSVTVIDAAKVISVQTTGVGAYLLEKRGIHEVHKLPRRKTFFRLLCDSQ